MRISALFLLAVLFYGKLAAQGVSGSAEDNKGKPLAGATIALKINKDSVIIKLNVSDASGRYAFSSIPTGLYFITVSHVGYLPVNSAVFEVKEGGAVNVSPIGLSPVSRELKQVQVTGMKPLVEVDRKSVV